MKIETLIELLGIMAKAHPGAEVATYQYYSEDQYLASGVEVDAQRNDDGLIVVIR